MFKHIPDEESLLQFQTVVQSAQEPIVQDYLEEAYRCFAAGAYNAAIVMAWNAVISYARRAVEEISEPLFAYAYRTKVKKGENPPSELWRVSDNFLIQTCQKMGLMEDLLGEMEPLRMRRNECAHPSGFFASANEALAFVQGRLHSAVSRQIADERLTKKGILLEFVKETEDDKAGELLGNWIPEKFRSSMAHSMLSIFCSDAESEAISGVQGMWRGLWEHLNEEQKLHLWNRLGEVTESILSGASHFRKPYELADWIIWPPHDEAHAGRDRIGECFADWFEERLEENAFDEMDTRLARIVGEYMPTSLQEPIRTLRKEMLRRLAE